MRIVRSPCHDCVVFVGMNMCHINSDTMSKKVTRIHESNLVSCGIFLKLNTHRHVLIRISVLLLRLLFFSLRVLDLFIAI